MSVSSISEVAASGLIIGKRTAPTGTVGGVAGGSVVRSTTNAGASMVGKGRTWATRAPSAELNRSGTHAFFF